MSSDTQAHINEVHLGVNEFTLGLFGAAILLFGAVLWSAGSVNVERTDFSLTYVGASIVYRGIGGQLYDIGLQKQLRNSLFGNPNPLFFEHPPFEAFLLSPLAKLPFRTAYVVWGCFNEVILLALMFFMRQQLPAPRESLGYIALWLLFAPTGVALFQGQSSLILLAAFCAAFLLLQRGHQVSAGAALGIGLFKFQFVLPFLFVFLLRKKWRFIGGFCITALVLAIVSLMATGFKGIVSYVRLLSDIGSNPQNLSYGSAVDMPTIHGFIYALLGRTLGALELKACVLTVSFALILCIGRQWNAALGRVAEDLMFGAAISASLLCGVHMFTHDFSPLLLALFLSASNLRFSHKRALQAMTVSTLVIFWIPATYIGLVAMHGLYLMCPVLLLFTFAMVFAAKYTKTRDDDNACLAQA